MPYLFEIFALLFHKPIVVSTVVDTIFICQLDSLGTEIEVDDLLNK